MLTYLQEHFACFSYEKGQKAMLEILKIPADTTMERDLVDMEIVLLIEGRIRLSYDKLSGQEVTRGKLMFFPPGSYVKAEAPEDAQLIICRVHDVLQLCECMSMEKLYQQVGKTPEGFHMLDTNERIDSFFKFFIQCVGDGLKCSFYFATKIKELFFLLRAYYTKEELAGFFSPMLGRNAQFMHLMYKNYRSVKSVQELAGISLYSISGFKKQFNRVFGMPASEWLANQKAALIFQDLNNCTLPIKELADMHNFSSVSAFTTFCRKKFGMPPGKIRLNAKKQELAINKNQIVKKVANDRMIPKISIRYFVT